MSKPIILDCDPGHDDAMAILLARGCPDIDLRAITTVAGNQTLEKTTLNARRVCTAAHIDDVPIYAGCDRPLVRAQIIAADVHGESGLDGPVFGEPTVPVADEHAVDYLVRTLMASDGEITLVPVGPLTNIAMALRREPRIAQQAAGVVLMGGAYTRGNRTPAATLAAELITQRLHSDEGGEPGLEHDSATLHDALCIAYLIDPAVVTLTRCHAVIETYGRYTAGRTVLDLSGRGAAPNAWVALRADAARFFEILETTFSGSAAQSGDLT